MPLKKEKKKTLVKGSRWLYSLLATVLRSGIGLKATVQFFRACTSVSCASMHVCVHDLMKKKMLLSTMNIASLASLYAHAA